MSKLYTSDAVEQLARMYCERDGEVITVEEGTLGWGLTVMRAQGCKTAIVKEVPLNEWSSAHTIRLYNKCPKKYEQMVVDWYSRDESDAA